MRVLFTTSPLYGHFFPMLPLIDAFRSADHAVTVASGPDLADAVRRRDLRWWPVGPSTTEVFASLRERGPDAEPGTDPDLDPAPDHLAALRRDAISFFGEPAIARTTDLLPMVDAEPPDLVVHEHSDLAGWLIAARLGQRPVAHGYGPHLPFTRQMAEILFAAGTERFGFGPTGDAFGGAVYVDPWPTRLQSSEDVGYGQVLAVRPDPEPVGPADRLPPGFERLPHDRTVYATLGTVFTDVATMRDLVGAVAELPLNLVLTTGPAVDPGTLGTLPSSVIALSFVPQAAVLPRCSAVLSHAGSGTVLGALAAHLPQVCLPSGADQFINADRIAATGAGLDLPATARSPEQIRDALLTVLGEPSFAAAARELQRDVEAMPPARAVIPDLLAAIR